MTTETAVQQDIRLAAGATQGVTLWRNNTGAATDKTGRTVRFGLGNDSAKINQHMKSADLIGFQSVVITPDMVGQRVAVFTACEVKKPHWVYTDADERAKAQLRFLHHVMEHGGRAGFARSVEEFRNILL